MFETGDEMCPVSSFKLYLSLLNPKCDAFLQRPNPRFFGMENWYCNAPIGLNTIGNFMKDMTKEAECSRPYTNHCLKASTATILKQAGFQAQDIMAVTGHRNVASLESYAQGPTIDDRARMSKELAQFGKENEPESTMEIKTTSDCSTAIVETTKNNIVYENTMSSIFAGASFNGNVTINVQINK